MKNIFYFVIIALLFSVAAFAQVPRTISYQGMLTDASGKPVPDGNKNLTVSLYADASGGSPLYSETQSVTVTKGIYTMIIGSATPIPPTLSFDNAYFLGVAIEGGTELAPRTALTSAPYALHAALADGASSNAVGIVRSLNNLSGALTLQGSGGTTITSNGHTLTISSSGSAGGGIQGIQSGDGTLTILNSAGPIADLQISSNAITTKFIADAAVTAAKISADGGDLGQVLTSNGFGIASWKNPAGIVLPFSGTVSSGNPAFMIFNTGAGTAISAQSGSGVAISGISNTGNSGNFSNVNAGNSSPTVSVMTNGSSAAISSTTTGTGRAGLYTINLANNSSNALEATTNGTGTVLKLNHTGGGGNIAIFQSGSLNVARIDKTGKGFFNGGTQSSGADVAEAFAVVGKRSGYEPGDVLAIASGYKRTVEKCSKPYSTNVIGVHATKPGVLLTARDVESNLDDLVPMGVVGVIPTKVCNEGGMISAGDLLVTSSRLGYAMRADPKKLKFGMVIGKALEGFSGESGMIEVFVNVK